MWPAGFGGNSISTVYSHNSFILTLGSRRTRRTRRARREKMVCFFIVDEEMWRGGRKIRAYPWIRG